MNEIAVRRVVIAVVVLSLSGCDLVKKLADKEDKGGASGQTGTASADPDGLPQECVDYLAIFKCVNAKNNPATAQSQVDGLRVGFKAVVTNSGVAAAQKQCVDLLTSSQDGYAKLGCTKASTAVGAAAAQPSAAPSARPTVASAAPKASVAVVPKPAAKKAECSCGPGQVLFSDSSTVICAELPCRSPGGSCKKADGTSGSCLELGTGEAGQRVRCGHLVQCL